jgi:hypothetical protein
VVVVEGLGEPRGGVTDEHELKPIDTGVCDMNAHRSPMILWDLGPWKSPNHIRVYGLVTLTAPNPIDA